MGAREISKNIRRLMDIESLKRTKGTLSIHRLKVGRVHRRKVGEMACVVVLEGECVRGERGWNIRRLIVIEA